MSIFSYSNAVQLREESGVCVKYKLNNPTKINESLNVIHIWNMKQEIQIFQASKEILK